MLPRFVRTILFVAYAIVHDAITRSVTRAAHKEAISRLQKLRTLADEGHAESQYDLAAHYRFGLSPAPTDHFEAEKWFRQAAEQSHAEAQNQLGEMLQIKKGTSHSVGEAAKWLRKAAEQGHSEAQNNLGCLYLEGAGVSKSYSGAMEWFLRASDQMEAQAQFNLAKMYASGIGVPRSDIEAYMWCEIALECLLEKGHDMAHPDQVPALVDMLHRGMHPAEINKAKRLAREWLEKREK